MQKQVQSLGHEDTLGKEMATHSSILTGKFHGQRSLVDRSPRGRKESETEQLKTHTERCSQRDSWAAASVYIGPEAHGQEALSSESLVDLLAWTEDRFPRRALSTCSLSSGSCSFPHRPSPGPGRWCWKLSSMPATLLNHLLAKAPPSSERVSPRSVCPPRLSSQALWVSPQHHKGHLHLVTILTSTPSQRSAPTGLSSLHPDIIPHAPNLCSLLVHFYLSLTISDIPVSHDLRPATGPPPS